jgi:predicted transcriptional regulator
MAISIKQIKAARALLGWSQEDLSEKSGVALPTIKRIEASGVMPSGSDSGSKIEAALIQGKKEAVVFINADGKGGAGVRLK